MSFFHHLQPYVNSMVPQCSPGLMGRAFLVFFTELGHLSEVLVCVGHLAASPTLAGLRLCPLNLQAWKRPLLTTGVYIWSNTPLAPAHCSVLDSIFFFPPRVWVYFLSFEFDYVFKIVLLFVCMFLQVEGTLLYQFSLLFCSFLNIRDRDQGQKLGIQWHERNRNRKWNPTRRQKKQ